MVDEGGVLDCGVGRVAVYKMKVITFLGISFLRFYKKEEANQWSASYKVGRLIKTEERKFTFRSEALPFMG